MTTNIALLGSGLFANNAYLPALLADQNKHINLHTVWSRSQSSAEKLVSAAKDKSGGKLSPKLLFGDEGLEKVLADKEVQGVMIVLPISTQKEYILKALKAGKHVMSEKPVAKDVATARGLIEEYEKTYKPKGLIWRVAEDFDHEPILHRAAQIIKDPSVGPVLYWNALSQTVIVDGSAYQATEWRTIPDYQGGFLLDGGVHQAALIRLVLPTPPEEIISISSLHRAHIPPHDTVQALALCPSTTHEPYGPETKLKGLRKASEIPGAIGKSTANGTITFSFATPNVGADKREPSGLIITCQNAIVKVQAVPQGGWTVEVIPGDGTDVKPLKESVQPKVGVREECAMFGRAIAAVSGGGKADPKEQRGEPRDTLWDLALVEALLSSNGEKISMKKLIEGK